MPVQLASLSGAHISPTDGQIPMADSLNELRDEFQSAYARYGGQSIWLVVHEYDAGESKVATDISSLSDALGLHGQSVSFLGGHVNFSEFQCRGAFAIYFNGSKDEQAAIAEFKELANRAGAYVAAHIDFDLKPALLSPTELWVATVHIKLRESTFSGRRERDVIYRPFLASIETIKRLEQTRANLGVAKTRQSSATDLLTTSQLACLAGVGKRRFLNVLSAARTSREPDIPTPAEGGSGTRDDKYSYEAIRPFLQNHWQERDNAGLFPSSFDEAKALLNDQRQG